MSDEMQLKDGEYLLYEGERSDEMYFVKEGTLTVTKKRGSEEKQIGTIYSGEIIGEMSFLDREPRSASVKATGDCHLTIIERSKFDKDLKSIPPWYKGLLNTLLERLRKANTRIKV